MIENTSAISIPPARYAIRPHWTVRNCIWNGMTWTISATVPTKLEYGEQLYSGSEVARAVEAERARFDGLLLAVKDLLSNTCLSEARFAAESRALSEYKRLSGPNT